MIDFNITDEELNALKIYKDKDYEAINQMLVSNSENDIALLSAEVENRVVSIVYNRESVIEYLKNIKLIYRLILKYYYSKKNKLNKKVYRGTNLSEIERVRTELYIDRFLSATENENEAINLYSANWNRPACMNLILDEKIPYIFVKDILRDKKYKNEILISPFTKIKFITEVDEKKLEKNSKLLKVYEIELEKQELDELSDRERNGLYSYILENSYSIKRKLEECIELEKENVTNFENIRKLEQLLRKYENEIEEKELSQNYSDKDREEDLDDVERITNELNELKRISANLFEIRKENINFVNMWKRNIAVYMIAECREIEKAFEMLYSNGIMSEVKIEEIQYEEDKVKENIPEVKNVENEISDVVEIENKNEDIVIEKGNSITVKKELEGKFDTKEIKEENSNKFDTKVLEKNDLENKEKISNLREETEKILKEVSLGIAKEQTKVEETKVKQDTLELITKGLESNKVEEKEPKIEEKEDKESKDGIKESNEIEVSDEEKTRILKIVKENKSDKEDEFVLSVKKECDENIEAVEKLLGDIKALITKQQNHAKIAGNIGSTYSALNNAFEMRKVSDTLLELLKNVKLKVEVIGEIEESGERNEKLAKISKKNIEISTLINYLNNPKIAARNSKATRFDEMAIIEENELKRGIAEKIREIRGEAELKKLKDDWEIIEDKGSFSRFIGIFTGQNKLDEFMLDQIELRQSSIRRTLSKKLSLAYNYSIHELMAEISMFISENEDDELVKDDILDLKAIGEELKRNFVVLETKVQSIIFDKEGRNLPLDSRRTSKMEIIEIETYRFLKKYGYDGSQISKDEPKYQDTMASEIARIVEYINSASIL